ncbi:DUF1553 domain-containing protein [Schlesneria paludicola]|uniref:DUF1553 domain-containing protein n=1 Tax=Schlesneria paludicola TaxID=360056 RepID=UPI00029A32EA|nr:DUF1553 domain-containing protein [Schlesneria paludicola]
MSDRCQKCIASVWRSGVCLFVLLTAVPGWGAEPIHFNRDIRPILSDKCFSCHGLDKNARKADLRLDLRESAVEKQAIVPGSPDTSEMVHRILSSDDDELMPPPKSNKPLTLAEKNLLKQWIAEGAEYHPHWAFIAVPTTVPVPHPADAANWIRSPIDAYILDRLQRERVEPAAEATREKWLRRVSFDLIGLPPSTAALDAFLVDTSANAYERAIDQLLESNAYGERMANEWLDVARYADTFGYQADRNTHVWPWRDWVIRAFNENLHYDQFMIWQTAGDLLPNPTHDQLLATTFNRLHRQTNEGGSIEEEFRQAYIADRVVTNGTAFLGLTFECARCHDHKYDPISQANFYEFAAFFANIDEHGLYSHFTETAPTPALPLFEGNEQLRHDQVLEKLRAQRTTLQQIRTDAQTRFLQHPLSKACVSNGAELTALLASHSSRPLEPKLRVTFDDAKVSGENRLVPGVAGQAIEFGGDEAFKCVGAGQFGRTDPFTISCWLKSAEQKPRIVVAHQCVAAEDAAYRGYSLILDSGRLKFSLVHFWPGNAIQVETLDTIPIHQWTQVVVTYDGSSSAAGLRLFIDGQPADVKTTHDNLTRDITYRKEWGDSNSEGVELSLGARFRDVGFRLGQVDELQVFDRELTTLEVAKLNHDVQSPEVGLRHASLEFDQASLFEHYLRHLDGPYMAAMGELRMLERDENDLISKVRQIMVMHELPEPRPMHVLKRGAYDAPGEAVTADTPSTILPFAKELPRNRLGLARWMTDPKHPLTSRVAVNRFWGLFFGRGLVPSVEDFGGQGQLPSHPELLDWLARDFMNHDWDVKRLCKQIALSATYRQSSIPRDTKLDIDDPDNILLGRGSRYRLPAEQIRDNALAVSGLLVKKLGGPSVMPYQPAGLWEEAGTGKTYQQAKGEGLYRRSLYTFWRRTSPPPSMLTFDATGREVCTARRERTATPLQALVLLNDPQYVEAARVLAEKALKRHPGQVESQIRDVFRELTSRLPTPPELDVLIRLHAEQKRHFEMVPDDAKLFLSVGDSPRDEQLSLSDHAALSVIVETMLSFDECVTKR